MSSVVQRYNVRFSGVADGPAMVFAHGFGCDQTMWRFITPAFEQTHRIVSFDYIGHGGSDHSAWDSQRHRSLDGYASDIIEICDALGLRDVTLVGHSVSGTIAMLAAIRDPHRFTALVLVAPSPAFINDGDYHGGFTRADIDGLLDMLDSNYLGWASTMAPVIMGAPHGPELSRELENSFCRTNPEIAKEFARVTFLSDHRADLIRNSVRTLLLQVTNDAIAPVSVGEYMHAHMPNSSLVLIDTVGHCPHLSAPAPTIAAMKRFLSS